MGGRKYTKRTYRYFIHPQGPSGCKNLSEAGWMQYFHRLHGFNKDRAFEFAQSLKLPNATVCEVTIQVKEKNIAKVTGLPKTGEKWFERKSTSLIALL
jgi:hypothetical protein